MQSTPLNGIYVWSEFQEDRNIDFNGFLWSREDGNAVFDPMPLDDKGISDVLDEGGAEWIFVTSAEHMRASAPIGDRIQAELWAHGAERERFGDEAGRIEEWFEENDDLPISIRDDIEFHPIRGGKSPIEPCFYLKPLQALYFGDIVRTGPDGALMLLPDPKLTDRAAVIESLRALAELPLQAVLVGDGASVFDDAQAKFAELLAKLS